MEQVIQNIFKQVKDVLDAAVGPNNRRKYMEQKNIEDPNWHFGLTPKQIIEQKIPASVMGCTGIAKLFYELSKSDKRLKGKVFVVCTAKYDDWKAVKEGKSNRIRNGHQINAVEIDGKLKVFDAGRKNLKFIETDLKPGSFVDSIGSGKLDHIVTAVVKGEDFLKMDTYQKLHNLYVSGDMNNPEVTIKPRMLQRGIKLVGNKIKQKIIKAQSQKHENQ